MGKFPGWGLARSLLGFLSAATVFHDVLVAPALSPLPAGSALVRREPSVGWDPRACSWNSILLTLDKSLTSLTLVCETGIIISLTA